VSIINNKIEYKNIIPALCVRAVRDYVQNGTIGVTPPRRSRPEMSVPQAMRLAGFDEKECKDRTIQMRVRRAKNKLLVSKLHGSAVKEAAIAWKAEWEKKTRGELHVTARKVVSIINNKIEYKNNKPALRVRTSWC